MFIDSNFEKIKFLSPKVSAFKLLRTHGYKNKDNIKKRILDSAEKALERLTNYSSPVGYFYFEEIKKKSLNSIQLERTSLKCEVFTEIFSESNFLIIFIISLGKGIDIKLKKISNDINEPLGGLFLENASWLALELILRDARSRIISFAKSKNLQIENRMAPGYSYPSKILKKRIMWQLEEQENLFKLFENRNICIRLTDSFTMLPRMSRSGVFGLKKKNKI